MVNMTLSAAKYPNGTNMTVASVTDIGLINPCIVPLPDKNSIVIIGGVHNYPTMM
jgi:hypothetical protein